MDCEPNFDSDYFHLKKKDPLFHATINLFNDQRLKNFPNGIIQL